MKKIIALLLAVMMLSVCLVGCGSKPAETPAPEASQPADADEPAG